MTRYVALLALLACNNDKDPEPFTPDTTETQEDTDIVDTAEDTDIPPPPRDSGLAFVAELVGYATVDQASGAVSGWEATAFSWIKDEVKGKPKCVVFSELNDWPNDPERDISDPLRDQHPLCADCAFAFTASFGPQEDARALPWAEVQPPEPTGDGAQLSCENLRMFEVLSELRTDPFHLGYGYKPNQDDPSTGAWMIWVQNDSTWAPYNYNATLSGGVFQWTETLFTYTY
jgi:hypothetical protein